MQISVKIIVFEHLSNAVVIISYAAGEKKHIYSPLHVIYKSIRVTKKSNKTTVLKEKLGVLIISNDKFLFKTKKL